MKLRLVHILAFLFIVLAGMHIQLRLDQKKTAFAKKERLFAEFEGKKELERRLLMLQDRHRKVLDSMGLAHGLSELPREVLDRRLRQVESLFAEEEMKESESFTEQIWKQIDTYVAAYAEQEGIDYLFGTQKHGTVMYGSQAEDVTDEIIEYANRKYNGF